ncbi:hypothetical protein [Amycolatopsis alba]|uniref:Protein kinase domain-containing protein n=1 Tax=Amycolatopsis alba DSM 44262 TaxID=1125972 RepID=A0A229RJS5_AMYAL|nr:hypothetical protein [Amycolatopsis alba]OXM46890.1 hypothetical protein CFP75_25620 [Amycolatopsis alba DSM 44262]
MDRSEETVRCRDVSGRLREIRLSYGSDFVSPGSVLSQQLVKANEQLYVRKFVSKSDGGRHPRLYRLLDNEVRAGTRLAQVFADRYPAELARLVAYNMDTDEPFVLLRAYLGDPAAAAVKRFDDAERRQFQIGVLRALHLTGVAGVVHGAVSLDAVRWSEGQVQLVDFESAERAGEPRADASTAPVRSPEQIAGEGVADVRDDLWAAGGLIRALYSAAPQDRSRDPERLRVLLGDVFDNPLEHRPHAADLLQKLHAPVSSPPVTNPDDALREGRSLFDRISADRRRTPGRPSTISAAPRPKSALLMLAVLAVVVCVITGLVVLL